MAYTYQGFSDAGVIGFFAFVFAYMKVALEHISYHLCVVFIVMLGVSTNKIDTRRSIFYIRGVFREDFTGFSR